MSDPQPAPLSPLSPPPFYMSPTVGKLLTALAAAQGEMKPPKKDKTVNVQTAKGGSYAFSYATMAAIKEVSQAVLTKHGLSVTHLPCAVPLIKGDALCVMLGHSSGEWIAGVSRLIVPDNNNQAYASACSYNRRHSTAGILALVSAEDDDGNIADGNTITSSSTRKASVSSAMRGVEAGTFVDDNRREFIASRPYTGPVIHYRLPSVKPKRPGAITIETSLGELEVTFWETPDVLHDIAEEDVIGQRVSISYLEKPNKVAGGVPYKNLTDLTLEES